MKIKTWQIDLTGTAAKGIQFQNDDSVVLSLNIGNGGYHSNRYNYNPESWNQDAEMAVWREGQDMENLGNDQVIGYVNLIHLPKLLTILCNEANAEKKIAEYLRNLNNE